MKKKKTYVICAPVYNLELSKEINSEIAIDGVTIISSKKIPYVRKRLGFQHRISELNKDYIKWIGIGQEVFNKKTYAILKWKLAEDEKPIIPFSKIRNSIWILASSQFSASVRGSALFFGFPEHESKYMHSYLLYDPSGIGTKASFTWKSPIQEYKLDAQWKSIMRHHYFPKVLKIINEEVTVDKKWRESVKKATIFTGRSILSSDLSLAFLYDMIALESLLTGGGEKHRKALIERLFALLSWYFDRTPGKWEAIIDNIYKLRNELIHDGNTNNIRTEDLISVDILLYNLLCNVGSGYEIIKNQQDLIILSEKVKAMRLLKLKVKSPYRARFSQPSNIKSRIDWAKKQMEWQ